MVVLRWIPLGVGLAAFAVFALAAAPGPYWLDSQELAAAGVRLGVAHPTGFPLFCILGRLAALVPLGELAFRVHLTSAASAAVAVALTSRLALDLAGRAEDGAGLVGGVLAGAVLAVSTTFFREAIVSEVYAPSAALLAASLRLARCAARDPSPRALLVAAFACGLCMTGAHAELRLLVGLPVAAWCGLRLRHRVRSTLMAPTLIALGALGIWAYLPLRSASGQVPALDWGHPSTARGLLLHASAARIRAAYQGEMLSAVPEVVGDNARRLGRLVASDFGGIALALAGGGLAALLFRRGGRTGGALLGSVVVLDAVYAVWVNPMGLAERQNGVPLALALAVLVGVGAAAAGRRFGRAAPFVAGAIACMALVPAALDSLAEKRAVGQSDAPREWAETALAECPPRAIALVEADSTAAGLLWQKEVEGARPDVAVLVRQHLWDLRRDRLLLAAVGAPASAATGRVLDLLSLGRPVRWEPGIDAPPGGSVLSTEVPLARLVDRAEVGSPTDSLEQLRLVFAGAGAVDDNGRRMLAVALTALGRAVWAGGDVRRAADLFAAARRTEPRHAASAVDLGVVLAAGGDFAGAATATEEALAFAPNHPTALVNAARYRLALGEDARARVYAERAVRVAPGRADAWALVGILDARAGRMEEARRSLDRALALDPSNTDARATQAKLNR